MKLKLPSVRRLVASAKPHRFSVVYRDIQISHWNSGYGFGDRSHFRDIPDDELWRSVHGHNLKVKVDVWGVLDATGPYGGESRFLIDEVLLRDYVQQFSYTFLPLHPEVLRYCDSAGIPRKGSQEVLCMAIADRCIELAPRAERIRVCVWETVDMYTEYVRVRGNNGRWSWVGYEG